MINAQLLELPMSLIYFHGPKDVRTIVRLSMANSWFYANCTDTDPRTSMSPVWPRQAKKCFQTRGANFADSDHPVHVQSVIRVFALHYYIV